MLGTRPMAVEAVGPGYLAVGVTSVARRGIGQVVSLFSKVESISN